VIDTLGRVNLNEADELRSALPEPLRQAPRRYLKDGISRVLADDLLNDDTRAFAALALARIGDPEDLADRGSVHLGRFVCMTKLLAGCSPCFSFWLEPGAASMSLRDP